MMTMASGTPIQNNKSCYWYPGTNRGRVLERVENSATVPTSSSELQIRPFYVGFVYFQYIYMQILHYNICSLLDLEKKKKKPR